MFHAEFRLSTKIIAKFYMFFTGLIAFVVVCYLRNSFFKSSCKYSALVGHNNLRNWSVHDDAVLRPVTESAEGLAVLQAIVMDLKTLSGMKVGELKDFLRLRGLKLSGNKEELVARVFVAIENGVQVVKTAEEVQLEIANEYRAKLIINDKEMPDPLLMQDGWLNEEDGIKYWPVTLYPDIYSFLAFHPNELSSNDLSDYKTSKAYSYYATGWLLPLFFHNINGDSKYCFIKGACKPSQRLNDTPHKLWLCLSKDNGKIMRAHCTCMAGLSQTCNHVAAALFRIEAASRLGLNNQSCTSKACEWLPNNKAVKPIKIKDLKLCRDGFGTRAKKKGTKLNSSPRKRYDPLANNEHKLKLEDIANALQEVCDESDCLIFSAIAKEEETHNLEAVMVPNPSSLEDNLIQATNASEFMQGLRNFTESDIEHIETMTRGQSNNLLWFSYRKHTITASKAHDVMTRCITVKKSGLHVDGFSSIFAKISGEARVNPELPALRYGRAMEDEAVMCFVEQFSQTHKDVRVSECGLFLCKDYPFVGGSPDRIIECACCGKSCLEVKCPFSVRHTSPVDTTVSLPYLKSKDGATHLNQRHK